MTIKALSIEYDKATDFINLTVLQPKRFTHYGFGTFLENVQPGEIEITPEAKEVLLNLPERPGFQGMEFWPDNRLAWASPAFVFTVSTADINMPSGAKQWVNTL